MLLITTLMAMTALVSFSATDSSCDQLLSDQVCLFKYSVDKKVCERGIWWPSNCCRFCTSLRDDEGCRNSFVSTSICRAKEFTNPGFCENKRDAFTIGCCRYCKNRRQSNEQTSVLTTNTSRQTTDPTSRTTTTLPTTTETTTAQASPSTAVSHSSAYSGMNTESSTMGVHGADTPKAVVIVRADDYDRFSSTASDHMLFYLTVGSTVTLAVVVMILAVVLMRRRIRQRQIMSLDTLPLSYDYLPIDVKTKSSS